MLADAVRCPARRLLHTALVLLTVASAGCLDKPELPDFDRSCGVARSMPCPPSGLGGPEGPRQPDEPDPPAEPDPPDGLGAPDEAGPPDDPGDSAVRFDGQLDGRVPPGDDAGPDARPDPVRDAAPRDAAPRDEGLVDDAGLDAQTGVDAERDALPDAERHAEPDTGPDAEPDGPPGDLEDIGPPPETPPPVLIAVEPANEAPVGAVVGLAFERLVGEVASHVGAFDWDGGRLPLEHALDSSLDEIRYALSDPDGVLDPLPIDGWLVVEGPDYVTQIDYRITAGVQPEVRMYVDADDGDRFLNVGHAVEIVIVPYVDPIAVGMALLANGEPIETRPVEIIGSDADEAVLTILVPPFRWPDGAPPRLAGRISLNFGPRFQEVRTDVEVMP